jgi:hypothetical protein
MPFFIPASFGESRYTRYTHLLLQVYKLINLQQGFNKELIKLTITLCQKCCLQHHFPTFNQRTSCLWTFNDLCVTIYTHLLFGRPYLIYIYSREGVLRVTYKTGFGLDDRIYWHLFFYTQYSGRTIGNTALSLIYTLYSSLLHTH